MLSWVLENSFITSGPSPFGTIGPNAVHVKSFAYSAARREECYSLSLSQYEHNQADYFFIFCFIVYSRTSLSRTRLFRITAYLEVKTWSLF